MELLTNPEIWISLITLTVLEIVLGIDNVIFISILASKLPKEQQARARNLGLTLAMVIRVILVFFAGWIITLKEDVVVWFGMGFSIKDFILIAGGLFLVFHILFRLLTLYRDRQLYRAAGDPESAASATMRRRGARSGVSITAA